MNRTVTVRFPAGREHLVEYPDTPLMAGVVTSIFERNEYPAIDLLQGNASVIVDVGANIGCTAVVFAAQYPAAVIYALEPAADAFALLQKNTRALPQVKTFHLGAYARDVEADLFMGSGASVTNSLVPNAMTSQQRERVKLRRITTWLDEQKIDRISLLKIDTEGAEMAILEDLRGRLGSIDALFVEYHSEDDRRAIDAMLAERFLLYKGLADHPHRGTFCYVSKFLLGTRTRWGDVAIAHPQF